jgi:cell division transport system permease protein
MSTSSETENGEARDARMAAMAEPPLRTETPIVPRSTISGRALTAVVAIMTFLASLTMGGVIMVRAAANEWQADVAREVTIQVRPTPGRDIEADVANAAAIARSTPGVADARPYSREETAGLLEPWLGSGLQFDDLPMPRIIAVRVAPGVGSDFALLRRTLGEQVSSATLDDHRGFTDRMRAMSSAVLAAGVALLALVLVATVLSVTFATSAAIATNRPVIEVLHLIGAKDNFIAGHFQRHFLQLGLKGGLIGGGCAVALFALTELMSGWYAGPAGGNQLATLLGSHSIGALGYVLVPVLIGLIAIVTAAASRYTVNRTIATVR